MNEKSRDITKGKVRLFFLLIFIGSLIIFVNSSNNVYAACIQDSYGGQCVGYVRDYFGGSYDSMPGLCAVNPDCGAYNAWGSWDLGYGGEYYPKSNSIMIMDQASGLPYGHMAVVVAVKYNFYSNNYTLTVEESNWDLDELVDCGVSYTYYPDQSEVTRQNSETRYSVLGFIYSEVPISIWNPFLFRANVGLNSINWGWRGCDPATEKSCDSLGVGCNAYPRNSTVFAENDATGFSRQLSFIPSPVNPNEYATRMRFDPSLSGSWTLTATYGEHSNNISVAGLGDNVELVPFAENVQLIGTGLTPTISWKVPEGTGADTVHISVIDGINIYKVWGSPWLGLETTEYMIPESANLIANYPYVIRIRLFDILNGTVYGPHTRSESFFNFTPLEGGEPDQVFLPAVGPDPDPTDEFGSAFMFNIDVEEGVPCFIDPIIAIGYDYAIGAEDAVKFASVTLPEVGDNSYDLYLFDGTIFYLARKDLPAGVPYVFNPSGVNRFRVLGIAKAAELSPNDTTAFITELTFTGSGRFTGTQTPITVFINDSGMQLVNIDIKPGGEPNCINVKKKGVTPAAIIASAALDASTIDASTVEIDDDDVPSGGIACVKSSTQKDVNGDGLLDLVVHFSTPQLNSAGLLAEGKTLYITGTLDDGTEIIGSDVIHMAGGPNCLD